MHCGAKTRSGTPCKGQAMANGRCRMHRGKAVSGIAHPNFQHGRYAKDIPTRMLSTYQAALADTELLNLRQEISLLDARLSDVLKRVDTGESGAVWAALGEALREFQKASAAGDTAKMREHLTALTDLIQRGQSDTAAWGDVRALIQERRRVTESERKRQVEMQQSITTERAMLLVTALVDTVQRHVHDRVALGAIAADIGALLNAGPP